MRRFNLKRILIIVIPIIIFILLTIYIQSGCSEKFEEWIYNESVQYMNPGLTIFLKLLTQLGHPFVIAALTLLLLIIPKTRKIIGYNMAFAVVVSEGLNLILKEVFARERPTVLQLVTENSYSFPSGHAMVNTTIYTIFALLAINYIKNKKLKITAVVACVVLPLIVSFSRVYLGVHHAGDVIAGILLGFSVAVFTYHLIEKEEKLSQVKT